MKRTIRALLLSLALCAGLTACGRTAEETPAPGVSSEALAQAVLASQADGGELTPLTGEALTDHLTAFCGLETWEEAAVYLGSGMDAREVTVVLLSDEDAAAQAAETLEDYRVDRQGDFFGYAPEEADRLERAAVLHSGRYAALLSCDDPEAAEAAFAACLAGEALPTPEVPVETVEPSPVLPESPPALEETEPPEETAALAETQVPVTEAPVPSETPPPPVSPEPVREIVNPGLDTSGFTPFDPPNEANMEIYDTSAIRAAWETGDESGLSEKDAEILARCREVLEEIVTEDMTDFEKELAVHDWIVRNGSYDQTVYSNSAHSGRTGYRDPYGILVGGYGNCLGYSSTFQLLMDLCGVECVTVVGAAYGSREDHAWNMVR
ncbi:MAG TPA: DUF4358 domain-containing protein, partial [Candidatus Intestinimonas pullistercoris]|nr:DUF4358 domain-containing protein [Candidatus Intestinimonas pullistercoris]